MFDVFIVYLFYFQINKILPYFAASNQHFTGMPDSLLILARMSPRGRNLGVKAEFLHSDPRDLVDSPQKSPHESYGGFCQNSRWPPHIVDKS